MVSTYVWRLWHLEIPRLCERP